MVEGSTTNSITLDNAVCLSADHALLVMKALLNRHQRRALKHMLDGPANFKATTKKQSVEEKKEMITLTHFIIRCD